MQTLNRTQDLGDITLLYEVDPSIPDGNIFDDKYLRSLKRNKGPKKRQKGTTEKGRKNHQRERNSPPVLSSVILSTH